MTRRGRAVAWIVIAVSLAFMAAYLAAQGETAREHAPPPVGYDFSAPLPAIAPTDQVAPGEADESPAPPPVAPAARAAEAGERAGPTGRASAPSVLPQPDAPPAGEARAVPAAPEPAAPTAAGEPRIHFDAVRHDFGEMYQEQEASHTFVFRNLGSAPLRIERVRSTCGCAVALPTTEELAPGGQAALEVTFRSERFRDRITKHVLVDSNDPLEPRVILTVTAYVKIEVDVVPRGIYLGRLALGDTVTRLIDVVPVEARQLRILEARSDMPLLQVSKPVPLEDPPGALRLTISFGPAQEPGRVNAAITIRTDLEHTPQIRVPVYGAVVAPEGSGGAGEG